MRTAVIIPSRYGSTRFPGKPLAMIAGKTLLQRVVDAAREAAQKDPSLTCVVATDDERIGKHADELGVQWVMTSSSCATGTDRVAEAVGKLDFSPDFILNLQGDAPLTPPDFLTALIGSYAAEPCDVVTCVTRLSWEALDKLREEKKATPFSGTTAAFDEKTGKAFWFSKNIFPALRKEKELRAESDFSPIWGHIGLYGYSRKMLETFVTLPQSPYEVLEGLEQLRVIEHGYTVRCVPVATRLRANMTGVDSPEDIARVEKLLS